ncbi:s-adenosyl-l-methionine-dependent methyltransferase domain-containing protein [Nannochloropsis gaditana CCMP526]|uniref:s-adenosyl-l-methionine-dependent methyltransferase domain-containing protein n=1 Tax=Nannochloropsis gaditana (strain CCMP526) TaxID=1093141 RepID=UPI00029F6EE0|nr:s-adenosyl-l-methionine-dependent methyltransferase domain-containing protein [Nannochloropsis gaditana CCMP526]EKU22180.1 s-adenosyl-l-methionine-dependent methyltransferase domain-containing protein [Nannochloropsis gaditana CCMP526]|eukprot:XP_005854179.1 s-adenosyl-l-methionine-dependent methyltransferase domain-containing protein [Nannochloropsis gaditana CCMP526]
MVDAENAFAREQLRLRGLLQDHIASFARRDGNVENSTRVVSASDGVVPRYIRIRRMASSGNNVGANKNHEEEEHTVREAVLAAGGRRVPWCPPYASESFYALPPEFRIAQWPLYQQGKVYGMDVASGVAVWALGPRPGDNVLDLCCCPGLKLCMVAEQMHHTGTITGVDISRGRLTVCRQILVKYQIGRAAGVLVSPCSVVPLWCRLLCADGCCFETEWDEAWAGREEDVIFDSRAYDWQVGHGGAGTKANEPRSSAQRVFGLA